MSCAEWPPRPLTRETELRAVCSQWPRACALVPPLWSGAPASKGECTTDQAVESEPSMHMRSHRHMRAEMRMRMHACKLVTCRSPKPPCFRECCMHTHASTGHLSTCLLAAS